MWCRTCSPEVGSLLARRSPLTAQAERAGNFREIQPWPATSANQRPIRLRSKRATKQATTKRPPLRGSDGLPRDGLFDRGVGQLRLEAGLAESLRPRNA